MIFTSFDLSKASWKILIILGVLVLAILLIIPSIYSFKNRKDKNKKNIQNDYIKNVDESLIFITEFEKSRPIPKKESKMFGIFNGVGHKKSAIRTRTLVYVYPEQDSCNLCQKYEGTIISLEELDNKYVTMKEAISNGYHHIGCKHIDIDYYENETSIPKSPWNQKQQSDYHKNVLNLFRLEERLRILTFQIDNNLSESIMKDEDEIERLKIEIKNFCLENKISYSESRFNPYLENTKKFKYTSSESEGN